MKKMLKNLNRSLRCDGVKRCERCGRMMDHYHYLTTSSDLVRQCVCADDRQCREQQQTRKQKQLRKLKERWAYEN